MGEAETAALREALRECHPGCDICRTLNGEHEGRDAEVAGPPQVDVAALRAALNGTYRANGTDWQLVIADGDGHPSLTVRQAGWFAKEVAAAYARLASTDKPDPAS